MQAQLNGCVAPEVHLVTPSLSLLQDVLPDEAFRRLRGTLFFGPAFRVTRNKVGASCLRVVAMDGLIDAFQPATRGLVSPAEFVKQQSYEVLLNFCLASAQPLHSCVPSGFAAPVS